MGKLAVGGKMTGKKTSPGKAPKTGTGWLGYLPSNPNARAWLLLVGAVGLHVLDEAVSGFFPFYQNLVSSTREQWGFFPMPVFPSFEVWLGGLIFAILIGLALTPLVAKGGMGIRVLVTLLAVLMVANSLGHTLGSVYAGRILPGFTSSFILFPAAVWMVYAGFKNDWGQLRMSNTSERPNSRVKNPERQKRLAEALRENLKKRKNQPKKSKKQKT